VAVTLNPRALALLLEAEHGPVGRDLQRRAERVVAFATSRASGGIIGIETGRLHSGIQFQIDSTATGLQARVFTTAMSTWRGQPFSYPAYQDQTQGRPWLSGALRAVIAE
jgi:hypothetical protein